MKSSDEVKGKRIGWNDTRLHPHWHCQLTFWTDAKGTGIPTAVTLQAASQLGGPIDLLSRRARGSFRGCMVYSCTYVDLPGIRLPAPAALGNLLIAGQSDENRALQVHLAGLGQLHQSPFIASSGHDSYRRLRIHRLNRAG